MSGIEIVTVVDVVPVSPLPVVVSVTVALPLVDVGNSAYQVSFAGMAMVKAPGPVRDPANVCPPSVTLALCVKLAFNALLAMLSVTELPIITLDSDKVNVLA